MPALDPPVPAALVPPVPAVLDPPVPPVPAVLIRRSVALVPPVALDPPLPALYAARATGTGPADAACAGSSAATGTADAGIARSGERDRTRLPAPGRCEADQEYDSG